MVRRHERDTPDRGTGGSEAQRAAGSGRGENYYVACAHHLLTRLLEYESAVLHAEYRRPPAGEVTSYISCRDDLSDGPDIPVGTSASPAEFRTVLARFGFLYIAGETYGGHSTVVLSQAGRKWRCHFFMANREAGFWIRVYAHAA